MNLHESVWSYQYPLQDRPNYVLENVLITPGELTKHINQNNRSRGSTKDMFFMAFGTSRRRTGLSARKCGRGASVGRQLIYQTESRSWCCTTLSHCGSNDIDKCLLCSMRKLHNFAVNGRMFHKHAHYTIMLLSLSYRRSNALRKPF